MPRGLPPRVQGAHSLGLRVNPPTGPRKNHGPQVRSVIDLAMAGLVGIRAEDMEQVDALQRARLEWPQGLPFIRPSVRAPVLVTSETGLDYKVARFGFSKRFMSFNARSENLTESRLWKGMFGKSHAVACLSYVVEWIVEGGVKTPYLIGRADRKLMWTPALVGPSLDNKEELGFSICTRP